MVYGRKEIKLLRASKSVGGMVDMAVAVRGEAGKEREDIDDRWQASLLLA